MAIMPTFSAYNALLTKVPISASQTLGQIRSATGWALSTTFDRLNRLMKECYPVYKEKYGHYKIYPPGECRRCINYNKSSEMPHCSIRGCDKGQKKLR